MKILKISIFVLLLAFISSFIPAAVPAPVLKWRNGGYLWDIFNKGMYTSPALLDIDQDGVNEIIWANFKVFAFDGVTGIPRWSFWVGYDRSNQGAYQGIGTDTNVAVADINGDGFSDVITAHTNGLVCAYDRNGYFLPGFPQKPLGRTESIETLSVFDLDNDGYREIIIGWSNPYHISTNPNAHLNVCVIRYDGTIMPGWPQYVPNPNANALGIFGQNIAVGDINHDGYGELVVPSDTGKTCAYYHDGSPLPINKQVYTTSWMLFWPDVVNYENYDHEKVGWFPEGLFYMGTDYPATIADVNADGAYEIIIVGGVYLPGEDVWNDEYYPLYNTPFIYNQDRTRFNYGVYNWESDLPKSGSPLTNSWTVAALKRANPVVVDIDGDGKKEILTSSFDGKLHCYWLDKSEHGHWPFSIYDPNEGIIRFSSEPAVADLDNDGNLEVVFASWPQFYSNTGGHLFILDRQGNQLHKVALPYGSDEHDVGELLYDGCLATPTIGDVDGDGQPEIVLGTVYAGLLVYDLPGTVMGSAPWPTGRHDYSRTGWVNDASGAVGLDSVQVLSPNGGENWAFGSIHNITWNSTGGGASVNIHFSLNGGASWEWAAAGTSNDGSFSWMLSAVLSDNCLVRVSDTDGVPADPSDSVFSISAPTVSVPTIPSGPASGTVGMSYSYSTSGSTSNLGPSLQYKFDWGDGTDSGWLAMGATQASHLWATAGTYTIRAMARCVEQSTVVESAWSAAFTVVVSGGVVSGAYNSPAQYKVLPEVIWAPATGGGTWVSEVQLTDVTGGSQVYVYYNTAAGRRGPFLLWNNTGSALSSKKFNNLLESIDGLDTEVFTYYGTVGAVEFITQDGSHLVHAAVRELNGNYAKTSSGLSLHDANTATTSRAMIVSNLSSNATYRTTVGFFNPTVDSLTVEFTLLDNSGAQIGTSFSKTLAGHAFQAFDPFTWAGVPYPGSSYDSGILRVRPTSGAGKLMCFGATANNVSNDPAAHVAVQGTAGYDNGPGSLQVLPEVIWASATGGGTWVSEVQLTDVTGGSQVSVYYNTAAGRRGPFLLWNNSGGALSSIQYTNLLQTIDGLDTEVFTYYGTVGSVEFVTQDGSHLLQAAVRELNGNYAKTFSGLNLVDAETADTARAMLIQNFTNNSNYRSTAGFFNPTSDPVTVELTLLDSGGAQIGSPFSKTLAGHEFQAFDPFTWAGVPYPGSSYDNVILRVRPTSGAGAVMCFGATANNASNDPASHLAVQGQ